MREFPRTLKIATVWLLVGVAVFLGFQTFEAHQQQARVSLTGAAIELRRGADGHFHWPGEVNGVRVDFLVDTGATATALPGALAARAGLALQAGVVSSTAAGPVRGHLARADIVLAGGVRAERLQVTVLPGLGAPLLGMDVLGRLHFTQEAGVLRISAPD
jgi:aspartyl protease family protein